MSHTPGPWRAVYDGSSVWSVGPDDDPQVNRVAMVERRGGQDTWMEAAETAALIAAAPDLLAALKACLLRAPSEAYGAMGDCWDVARAAIAKAEGR